MNKLKSFVIGITFCCVIVLLTGCSTSRLVNIWSDSSYKTQAMNKILVISVSKNSVRRRIWEDAFSVELAKHNITATPSYRLFPDTAPDTNQVTQLVKSDGYDGILITSRLPAETKGQYVQGYVSNEQFMRYDLHRERFITYYRDIEHAGYVDSQKVDIRVIDVWTTKDDGKIIWSGTSRTPEPNVSETVRPDIIELVLAELTKRGIIAAEL